MNAHPSAFVAKVRTVEEELVRRGVRRSLASPPLYRLLWRIGLQPRPPLFHSFSTLFCRSSIIFTVSMGTITCALVYLAVRIGLNIRPPSVPHIFLLTAVGGLAVGLLDGRLITNQARKLGLPEWE